MKTEKSVFFISLMLLFMSAFPAVTKAESWESIKKKEISKSFPIDKNSLLFVDNRFGNITITHWDKKEALIRAEIESAASREQQAQQNLDRIKVDLRKDGDKVSAITSWGNVSQDGNNRRLTVNYFISIPSTMKLELVQKYGNIVLPAKNEGESNLTVKFGNINAGSFTKEIKLDAKYGNVLVRDVVNATLNLGFCGDVELGDSKSLTIDSKYSTLKIGNSDVLNLENKFGNLKAGVLEKVTVEMKYSDVTIERLTDELLARSLDFGTLKINDLDAGFRQVKAEARYGTLDIRVSPNVSFQINAEQVGNNLDIWGLKETKHNIENKTNHYIEIKGGGSRKISFNGNRFSNLKISGN